FGLFVSGCQIWHSGALKLHERFPHALHHAKIDYLNVASKQDYLAQIGGAQCAVDVSLLVEFAQQIKRKMPGGIILALYRSLRSISKRHFASQNLWDANCGLIGR